MLSVRGERGSAPVEALPAILLLIVLTLGVTQVALTLYARNVLLAAAHEGARAAAELGRDEDDAVLVAERTVLSSARGLVRDLRVDVVSEQDDVARRVVVGISARLRSFGPIPVVIPVETSAEVGAPAPAR